MKALRLFMELKSVTSISEIEICVDMYLKYNDYSFLPADRSVAIAKMVLAARRQKFFKIVTDNSRIVAAILADISGNHHSDTKFLSQQYYASELTGVKAFRAIKLTHDALFQQAELLKCDFAASTGSHMDESHVFAKILEKQGWTRRGYLCVKPTQVQLARAHRAALENSPKKAPGWAT